MSSLGLRTEQSNNSHHVLRKLLLDIDNTDIIHTISDLVVSRHSLSRYKLSKLTAMISC